METEKAMQLSINGDITDLPVSTDLIAETVADLASKGDFFLILAKDEMTYIQTSGCTESGFILEYQDGSIEEHYSCRDAPLSADQIVETLQRYFTNHDRWKSEFTWEKEDLGSITTQANAGTRTIPYVLGVAAVTMIIWWYFAGA